jgi:CHAT domain-containing protein/tetratricopeptide (TPR) repeat protein
VTADLLDQARAALAAAREDPRPALQRASGVIENATGDEERATAHFAVGMAHRTLANSGKSTIHLEKAAAYARDLALLRGQILRSLAFNYAQSGRHSLADKTIEQSIDLLSGEEKDLSRLQKAFMLLMRGEHRAALPVLTAAIKAFDDRGGDDYLELTLYNRALIHMEMGDYDASATDLERAYDIGIRLDHQVSAAEAALHLSQVLGWKDDIPSAMAWHAKSVSLRQAAGADNPVADTEHAFLLIQARLMREAEEALTESLPRLVAAGANEAIAVQGHLLLAEVLSERGAHDRAAEQVALADAASPADGRYRFDIAAAGHRSRIAAGEATPDLLDSIVTTAAEMQANGERHAAAVERFRAVDVAIQLGDIATAARMCDDTARVVRAGPLWLQVQAWTALAGVRMAMGNSRGAAAAVRAGFNRLDEYRGGIGATDLRIRAAEYGERLASIGLKLAIESGSMTRVFDWAERLRTTSLRTRADASDDRQLRDALAQLRRVSSRLLTTDHEGAAELRQLQRRQEQTVRDLARRATGTSRSFQPVSLNALRSGIGDRALIEFIGVEDVISALVVTPTSSRLVELGRSLDAVTLVDQLRFAAERIARPSTSDASRAAAFSSVTETARHIAASLIDPITDLIGSRRPVIVPSRGLHGIPWGQIFSGPVEVAPSATAWLACRESQPALGSSVIVAGPGLVHATAESTLIGEIAGAPTVSTAAAALRGLPRARLAHFACHARPRLDSPMFSSLSLADGELTLYDIERLEGPPDTVVLAACDGGSAVMASGDEIAGLAAAFLSLGSRVVVAPLFTVSDEATAVVMSRFHTRLAAGEDAATALAATRHDDDPVVAFTARSFACFGAA